MGKNKDKNNKETVSESWFKLGNEGLQEKKTRDAVSQLKKERIVPRFWLKPLEEAEIVFVDDIGFYVKIHQLQIDGNWGNFITCIKDFAPCPVCNTGKKPTQTCHYTVIDTRQLTLKNGTTVKNRKVLYPAKGVAINMIADLKAKYTSLTGLVFKIKRYTETSPNCGDYFDLLSKKRVDLTKFGTDANVPFDYRKILAPPTDEELKLYGFGNSIVGDVFSEDEEVNDEFLSNILG